MAAAFDFFHGIAEKVQEGPEDWAISYIADRQHGVIARWQLLGLGIGRGAIDLRIERKRLHPVHRGVYAVGHRVLSADGYLMAAVLYAGSEAVASHAAAASIHGLRMSSRRRTDVTIPLMRRQCKVVRYHFGHLPEDEITTVRGIPVTTVPRTIFDIAATEPRRHAERAFHEAEVHRAIRTRCHCPTCLRATRIDEAHRS